MDIETLMGHPHQNPPSESRKIKTPTTFDSNFTHQVEREHAYCVSEFQMEAEVGELSKLLSLSSLGQKENERSTTDRFIPLRKHSQVQAGSCFPICEEDELSLRGKQVREEKMTVDEVYRCVLLESNASKMFKFAQHPADKISHLSEKLAHRQRLFGNQNAGLEVKLQRRQADPQFRKVSKVPFKVLDAPNLQDDFYLNLLEWSSQNILSVALDSSLYFWNANNNKVLKFCQLSPDSISSLNWNPQGTQIAIGTSKGTIQTWDVGKGCRVGQFGGHSARVSSVSWGDGVLASGSRDRSILLRDVRQRFNRIVSKYEGHTQQVCGLKWSFDRNLLASGGNDNKLYVWSARTSTPICKFSSHCAAVKGIAWSPHNHGVLASGGGSADKTIKFWNTLDSTMLDSIDTGSQVCNIMFSRNTRQIISTHGYSNNQIIIWKYPSLQKTATLTGHSSRVLFLAMNPSGQTIVTGAGDETLRFWNAFPGQKKKENRSMVLSSMELR